MTNPPPVYNPNVPLRKDKFNDSQEDFLINFSTLYNAFAINHIPLDAGSTAGNHTIVQLTEQTSQFQTNVGEINVYAKNIPGFSDQIFLRYQGNQDEFAYTCFQIYSIESTPNQTFFFTFLPGRVLLYFGTVIPNSPTFSLILNPPIGRNIICANFCPIAANGSIAFYPPIADAGSTIPGFFTQMNLSASFLQPSVNIPPCYYIVMANI